jgi:hypothetical protein
MISTRVNSLEVPSKKTMHPHTVAALERSRPHRRGIEYDYNFYDPPATILRMLQHGPTWPYSFRHQGTAERYVARDRAAMAIEYLAALRASELVRADVAAGSKLSILSSQFNEDDPNWLKLRGAIVLKHGVPLSIEDYPKRVEIKFPRRGGLSSFTNIIQVYLDLVKVDTPILYQRGVELFGFKRARLYQIVNRATGYGPHYLRAQGLKLVSSLVHNNLADLKKFSGHSTLESLVKYLHTFELDDALLSYSA